MVGMAEPVQNVAALQILLRIYLTNYVDYKQKCCAF